MCCANLQLVFVQLIKLCPDCWHLKAHGVQLLKLKQSSINLPNPRDAWASLGPSAGRLCCDDFCHLWCASATSVTGQSIPWCCPFMIYAVFFCDSFLLFPAVSFSVFNGIGKITSDKLLIGALTLIPTFSWYCYDPPSTYPPLLASFNQSKPVTPRHWDWVGPKPGKEEGWRR